MVKRILKNSILKTLTRFLILMTMLGVVTSCATKKRRSDPSLLGKLYHNTTAKFNGYYNATVLLDESILKLNDQYQDNYNKILPVHKYTAVDNPQLVSADLDKAIEKVSVDIALHRQSHWTDDCYLLMGQAQYLKQDYETSEETFQYFLDEFPPEGNAKKKKSSKLSAAEKKKQAKEKAEAREEKKKDKEQEIKERRKERERLQKERKKAIAQAKKDRKKGKKTSTKKPAVQEEPKKEEESKTFKEEKNPADEVKKQEEEAAKEAAEKEKSQKPKNYFFKHRPCYQEGQLWYARTLVEREKYDEAARVYNQLAAAPGTFKDIHRELAPAMAHYELKQKHYDRAIPHLENAVRLARKKQQKARYAFILAQVYQRNNQSEEAYAWYKKVLRYRPRYDMEFSARMKLAQNAWASGKSSREDIEKTLNKMLKDDKNIEYKDQIYYTLAQVALANNDRTGAIQNLELSLRNNTGNNAQKSESYYQLASLYFEDERYVKAKLYYDSTLLVMAQNDERYKEVSLYATNLTEIAKNIQIITLQDSLLRISELSPEAKRELALGIKKREEEERIRAAREAALDPGKSGGAAAAPAGQKNAFAGLDQTSLANRNLQNSSAAAIGNFFAYDDKALRRGKREFQKRWGNRPLVDNWRLSSKIESVAVVTEEAQAVTSVSKNISDEEVANIFADVPTSATEMTAAREYIEQALFDLGKLFREKLENYPKSIASFDELFRRFPETGKEVEAWYYLYLDYTDMKNAAKAKEYYDLITAKYPESMFARVLVNPDFLKESEKKERQLNDYYDATYAAFSRGQYETAYSRIIQVDSIFKGNNPLQARFALLSAMCLGNIQGKEAYINSLKDVIAKYPNGAEEKRAKEILRLLGDDSQSGTIQDGENNEDAASGDKNAAFKVENDDYHYIVIVLNENDDLNKAKSDVGDYHRQFYKLDNLRVSNIYLGDLDNKTPLIVVRRFKDKAESMRYFDAVMKNRQNFLASFAYQIYPISQNNYRIILKNRRIEGYPEFFQKEYLKN